MRWIFGLLLLPLLSGGPAQLTADETCVRQLVEALEASADAWEETARLWRHPEDSAFAVDPARAASNAERAARLLDAAAWECRAEAAE
ncbi:MAG: hypothetical protein F4Y00_08805 [Bacteroidetes bacterium SB0662_bin_6]|nr:hypothetical protein [Bacteroidetes bacterium SB0662_bin_6]